MGYRLNLSLRGSMFSVPTDVVDKELRLCGAAQLKVLLLLLRENVDEPAPDAIAGKLGLPAGDVCDALDYWAGRGLLLKDGEPAARICAESAPTAPAATPAAAPADLAASEPLHLKPSMKEVERYQKDDVSVTFALTQSEALLGRAFSSSDTATLVWLMKWAGMPADVLVTLVEYCRLSEKTSMRYIEKTALAWLDSGVDTIEAAEARIEALTEEKGWEGAIKAALNITGRPFSAKERGFAEEWRRLGISTELIAAAYERTLNGAGRLSFPYMNRILLEWNAKGITTPEQADAEKKPGADKEPPSFDVDEITRRMMLTTPTL